MKHLYGVCLSNSPEEVRSSLPTLAKYGQTEIQIELFRSNTNINGNPFAPDFGPAAQWLERQGVTVWGHVNVWWPPDPATLGQSAAPPERDQFYLRRDTVAALMSNDWWLYGKKQGERSRVLGSYNRPTADMTRDGFLNWAYDLLLATKVRRLRFDDGFIHRHGYYRPWQADHDDGRLMEGAFELYDELRFAGCEVVVNGAWEMTDPDAATWVYPALNHVDGVMIEQPNNGFARWNNGRWWALDVPALERVARDWRAAGKRVVISALWQEPGPQFPTFEALATFYVTLAERLDCEVAVANGSWNRPVWLEAWGEAETPEPPETDGLKQRLTALEQQAAQFEARLQALEAWRNSMKEIT